MSAELITVELLAVVVAMVDQLADPVHPVVRLPQLCQGDDQVGVTPRPL